MRRTLLVRLSPLLATWRNPRPATRVGAARAGWEGSSAPQGRQELEAGRNKGAGRARSLKPSVLLGARCRLSHEAQLQMLSWAHVRSDPWSATEKDCCRIEQTTCL